MSTAETELHVLQSMREEARAFYQWQRENLPNAETEIQKMKVKQDSFQNNARKEFPFYRVTKNVTLEPNADSSKPIGWSTGTNPDYKLLYTVKNNVPWEDRTADEKELLTALGHEGARYISKAFNVWEATLHKSDTSAYGLLFFFSSAVLMTEMCMSKRVSGDYEGAFMTQGLENKWKLTGQNWSKGDMGYGIAHLCPYIDSKMTTETSVIHFALPQLVAGKYPLDSEQLGIIPFTGKGAGHYE